MRTLRVIACGCLALTLVACSDDDGGKSRDSSTVDAAQLSDLGLTDQGQATDQFITSLDATTEAGAVADAGSATADLGTGAAPDHTENVSGIWHKPGKEDPLANCVTCHGSTLQGGTGPSCYSCHTATEHTILRGTAKIPHRGGTIDSCTTCHGPNNTGGLGPACSTCHG